MSTATTEPHISICFDEGYFPHALTTLASIYANNRTGPIKTSLITSSQSAAIDKKVREFQIKFNQPIEVIRIDPALLARLPTAHHITLPTYFRLLLADFLPNLNRTIYLDCDLVVELDIHKLWAVNLEGNALAVVPEREPLQKGLLGNLGLKDGFYFNAGVFLADLSVWRQLGASEHLVNWLVNNQAIAHLMDQDALNAVFFNHKVRLPRLFNINPIHENPREILKTMPERIIHFAGPMKPWHQWYDFYLRELFWRYAALAQVETLIADVPPSKEGQHLSIANQFYLEGKFEESARKYHELLVLRGQSPMDKSAVDIANLGGELLKARSPAFAAQCLRIAAQSLGLNTNHTDIYQYTNIY